MYMCLSAKVVIIIEAVLLNLPIVLYFVSIGLLSFDFNILRILIIIFTISIEDN